MKLIGEEQGKEGEGEEKGKEKKKIFNLIFAVSFL